MKNEMIVIGQRFTSGDVNLEFEVVDFTLKAIKVQQYFNGEIDGSPYLIQRARFQKIMEPVGETIQPSGVPLKEKEFFVGALVKVINEDDENGMCGETGEIIAPVKEPKHLFWVVQFNKKGLLVNYSYLAVELAFAEDEKQPNPKVENESFFLITATKESGQHDVFVRVTKEINRDEDVFKEAIRQKIIKEKSGWDEVLEISRDQYNASKDLPVEVPLDNSAPEWAEILIDYLKTIAKDKGRSFEIEYINSTNVVSVKEDGYYFEVEESNTEEFADSMKKMTLKEYSKQFITDDDSVPEWAKNALDEIETLKSELNLPVDATYNNQDSIISIKSQEDETEWFIYEDKETRNYTVKDMTNFYSDRLEKQVDNNNIDLLETSLSYLFENKVLRNGKRFNIKDLNEFCVPENVSFTKGETWNQLTEKQQKSFEYFIEAESEDEIKSKHPSSYGEKYLFTIKDFKQTNNDILSTEDEVLVLLSINKFYQILVKNRDKISYSTILNTNTYFVSGLDAINYINSLGGKIFIDAYKQSAGL